MFELFKDVQNEWRWRLVAANGKILADSAESYRRRGGAVKGIESARKLVAVAGVAEVLYQREAAGG